MDNRIFYNNVLALCKQQGLTLRKLAGKAGVSPTGVYRFAKEGASGRYVLTTPVRKALSHALGYDIGDMCTRQLAPPVALEDLLVRDSPGTREKRVENSPLSFVPLLSAEDLAVKLDTLLENPDFTLFENAKEYVPAPYSDWKADDLVFAWTMTGDAMAPSLLHGDCIYFRYFSDFRNPGKLTNGILVLGYAIEENGPHFYVRRYAGTENGAFWLKAENPDWPGERYAGAEGLFGRAVAVSRRL